MRLNRTVKKLPRPNETPSQELYFERDFHTVTYLTPFSQSMLSKKEGLLINSTPHRIALQSNAADSTEPLL